MTNLLDYSEKINFNKKVVIVTGAGEGLGKSYAIEFAARGANVIVNDFGCTKDGYNGGSVKPANDVVSQIVALGGNAVVSYDDVSTVEGGINIIKTAIDNFGTVDVLINNAGIVRDRSFAKMNICEWQSVLDVHLNGVYNVTRPAFEIMKSKCYGRIIMITSGAGLYGNFGQVNYSAAKMALVGMMNTLKIEGKKCNIVVNSVSPIAASRMTKDVMPEEFFKKAGHDLIVPLIIYLSSKYCSTSGGIYNVGMGHVSRVALMTSKWIKIANSNIPYTPEKILKNWEKINSVDTLSSFEDLNSMFFKLMTSFDD